MVSDGQTNEWTDGWRGEKDEGRKIHGQMERKSLEEAERTSPEPQRPAAQASETRCSICPQLLHLSLAASSQTEASISLSIGWREWRLGAADARGSLSSSPTCHQLQEQQPLTAGRHL